MGRAVAGAVGTGHPSLVAGVRIVGGELAFGGDDHDVADDERRARESPHRGFLRGLLRHVARPDRGPVARVERVEQPGRAERIDTTVGEGGRTARAGAGVRLPEARGVAMTPDRLAGAHVVAGDDLVVAELLLRVEAVAVDRERRPARADRAAPELDRRRLRPVGFDLRSVNDTVAVRSAETWPLGFGLHGRRDGGHRRRGGRQARRPRSAPARSCARVRAVPAPRRRLESYRRRRRHLGCRALSGCVGRRDVAVRRFRCSRRDRLRLVGQIPPADAPRRSASSATPSRCRRCR